MVQNIETLYASLYTTNHACGIGLQTSFHLVQSMNPCFRHRCQGGR